MGGNADEHTSGPGVWEFDKKLPSPESKNPIPSRAACLLTQLKGNCLHAQMLMQCSLHTPPLESSLSTDSVLFLQPLPLRAPLHRPELL